MMIVYQQPFWGYEVEIPTDWVHQTLGDTEGFASISEALQPKYEGENLGHLLIRGEWNSTQQPIEPLWNQHITRLSVMLGAKKLGSAPWNLRGGRGFEAEVMLPKKTNKRLWIGILAFGRIILHFMVAHWKEEREWFEPRVTQVIRSLRFISRADNIKINQHNLPIPPGYAPIEPKNFLTGIADTAPWQAYDGQVDVGALQAFFIREVSNYGWEIEEYAPYPAATQLGFARLKLGKNEQKLTVGLLPIGEKKPVGKIVIKTEK